MTDNFNQIRELLKWDSEDDYFFLSILQRKKDAKKGVKVNGTNNNSRLIKAYYIKSLEQLDFVEKEIIELCNIFNARAGINLNSRSFEKTALQHLKLVTDNIINGNYDKVYKTYSSAAGKFSHDKNKKWIIDVDKEDLDNGFLPTEIISFIKNIESVGDKYITTIPTKSGLHLITKPFNVQEFKLLYPELAIQKNNPTSLYIP